MEFRTVSRTSSGDTTSSATSADEFHDNKSRFTENVNVAHVGKKGRAKRGGVFTKRLGRPRAEPSSPSVISAGLGASFGEECVEPSVGVGSVVRSGGNLTSSSNRGGSLSLLAGMAAVVGRGVQAVFQATTTPTHRHTGGRKNETEYDRNRSIRKKAGYVF